jgi:tetratricopeptide (TPR) repeat protein
LIGPDYALERGGVFHVHSLKSSSGIEAMVDEQPKRSRTSVALLVLLFICVLAGMGFAIWSMRERSQLRDDLQKATKERDGAVHAAAEAKSQHDHAEAARKAAQQDRERAVAAEQQAEHREEDMKQVLAFFEDKLFSAGHTAEWTNHPTDNVTLREAVEAAEPDVAVKFAERPLAEAQVRSAFGWAYLSSDEPEQAVKQFQRALSLREASLGPRDAASVACRNALARAYRAAGQEAAASRLYDQSTSSTSPAPAMAVQGSPLPAKKQPAKDEATLRECLSTGQEAEADHWSTFNVKSMLGETLLVQMKYAEAEPLLLSGYEGLKKCDVATSPE